MKKITNTLVLSVGFIIIILTLWNRLLRSRIPTEITTYNKTIVMVLFMVFTIILFIVIRKLLSQKKPVFFLVKLYK
jgi:hypothetical protein